MSAESARLARPQGSSRRVLPARSGRVGASCPPRRPVLAAAGLVAVVAWAATGCSAASPDGRAASTAGSTSPATADPSRQAAAVGWNPCDGLTAARARAVLHEPVRLDTGTVDQPRCTLVPRKAGGPAYQVSYLWFPGGLDAALGSAGRVGAQLRPVRVPGAEAARMAVARKRTGVLVTGFVQTERLVQSVNAVQVRPYDEQAVVAGTRALLGELARLAPSPSAGRSPSPSPS